MIKTFGLSKVGGGGALLHYQSAVPERLPESPALQPEDLSCSAFRKCSHIYQRCQAQVNIHRKATPTWFNSFTLCA